MEDVSIDVPISEDERDPQCVANTFVHQYYYFLEKDPQHVYRFYEDHSVVTRRGPHGEMVSVTTKKEIDAEIMSSDYKGCSFTALDYDFQESLMGGVLVTMMGNVIGMDNVSRRFNQTFFLAKTSSIGYFVLNDIMRFLDPPEQETLPTGTGVGSNIDNVPETLPTATGVGDNVESVPETLLTGTDNGDKVGNVPSISDKEIPATLQPKDVIEADKLSNVELDKLASDIKSSVMLSDNKTEKGLTITIGETVLIIDNKKDVSPIDDDKKTESDTKDKFVENESKDKSALTDVALNEHQEAKKTSYASVVAKEAKVTSPSNISGYKIVRVAPNANQQLIATPTVPATATATPSPKYPNNIANNLKKEHIASNATPDSNNSHADVPGPKSIYIGNLPPSVTKNGLADALKIFGRIRPGGIQIRRAPEDGYLFGFVDFESASSASKAVEVHNVNVGGNNAYMTFKRSSGSRNGNGGYYGRSRNGNPKGQDTQEGHGNGSHFIDDNQAMDVKSHPDEENNWQSHHRGGRVPSKNRQFSNNGRLHFGEALAKNGYPREERRDGDAYSQRYYKKQYTQ